MQPIDSRLMASPSGPATQTATSSRPAAPPPAENVQPSEFELEQAIATANTALKAVSSDLEFARDTSTGKTVVRVIDAGTQQVIRQFPSEEMLAIARALDRFQGLLLRQKA